MFERISRMFAKKGKEERTPDSIGTYGEFIAEFEKAATKREVAEKLLELTEDGRISWAPGDGYPGHVIFKRSFDGGCSFERIEIHLRNLDSRLGNPNNFELVVTKEYHILRFGEPIREDRTETSIVLADDASTRFAGAVRNNIAGIWDARKAEREKTRIRNIFSCTE